MRIPPGEFTLGELLVESSDIYLQFERIIPLEERLLPFFWVEDTNREHIEAALDSHPEVQKIDQIARQDGRYLYRAEWGQNINGVISSLRETQANVLEGEGTSEFWEFRLRFFERDDLQEFVGQCETKGIDVNVHAVFERNDRRTGNIVSDTQLETLLLAYERGYYDVPRRTSLSDLAEHFEVSEQAVSQRLRRGIANIIAENYIPD